MTVKRLSCAKESTVDALQPLSPSGACAFSYHRRGRALFMALLTTFLVARTSLQWHERRKSSGRSSLASRKLKGSRSIATVCPGRTWWWPCLLPYPFFPGHLETRVLLYCLFFPIPVRWGNGNHKAKIIVEFRISKGDTEELSFISIACAIYSLCVIVIKCLSSQSNNGYQSLSTFLWWSCEPMTPEPLTSRRFQSDYLKGCLEAW